MAAVENVSTQSLKQYKLKESHFRLKDGRRPLLDLHDGRERNWKPTFYLLRKFYPEMNKP